MSYTKRSYDFKSHNIEDVTSYRGDVTHQGYSYRSTKQTYRTIDHNHFAEKKRYLESNLSFEDHKKQLDSTGRNKKGNLKNSSILIGSSLHTSGQGEDNRNHTGTGQSEHISSFNLTENIQTIGLEYDSDIVSTPERASSSNSIGITDNLESARNIVAFKRKRSVSFDKQSESNISRKTNVISSGPISVKDDTSSNKLEIKNSELRSERISLHESIKDVTSDNCREDYKKHGVAPVKNKRQHTIMDTTRQSPYESFKNDLQPTIENLASVVRMLNNSVNNLKEEVQSIKEIKLSTLSSMRNDFSTERLDRSDSKMERFHRDLSPENSTIKPLGITPVYIRVMFMKIGDVDTLKENYIAKVCVCARWMDPSMNSPSSGPYRKRPMNIDNLVKQGRIWTPKIHILNSNEDDTSKLSKFTMLYNDQGHAEITEKREVRGTFAEKMELSDFPFDCQALTVIVTSDLPYTTIRLEPDSCYKESGITMQEVQSFSDGQEWRLNRSIRAWKETEIVTKSSEKDNTPTHEYRQQVCVACSVTRRPGFFIWNMFLIMFIICSLTFCTFVVSMEKPENRLQLSFTLVLTTIAFKFVANQTVPRISYLTYLDKYILTSMSIMCCICIWHSIVTILPDENSNLLSLENDILMTVDKFVLCILAGIDILFHILFLSNIYCRVAGKKRRRWRLFHLWTSQSKRNDNRAYESDNPYRHTNGVQNRQLFRNNSHFSTRGFSEEEIPVDSSMFNYEDSSSLSSNTLTSISDNISPDALERYESMSITNDRKPQSFSFNGERDHQILDPSTLDLHISERTRVPNENQSTIRNETPSTIRNETPSTIRNETPTTSSNVLRINVGHDSTPRPHRNRLYPESQHTSFSSTGHHDYNNQQSYIELSPDQNHLPDITGRSVTLVEC